MAQPLAASFCESLPIRERGLKHQLFSGLVQYLLVAPHTGAWIETMENSTVVAQIPSLPIRERGLKLKNAYYEGILRLSLPIRERGLKLCKGVHFIREEMSRSPYGSVD